MYYPSRDVWDPRNGKSPETHPSAPACFADARMATGQFYTAQGPPEPPHGVLPSVLTAAPQGLAAHALLDTYPDEYALRHVSQEAQSVHVWPSGEAAEAADWAAELPQYAHLTVQEMLELYEQQQKELVKLSKALEDCTKRNIALTRSNLEGLTKLQSANGPIMSDIAMLQPQLPQQPTRPSTLEPPEVVTAATLKAASLPAPSLNGLSPKGGSTVGAAAFEEPVSMHDAAKILMAISANWNSQF